MTLTERQTHKATWPAWEGRVEDLRRVANTLTTLMREYGTKKGWKEEIIIAQLMPQAQAAYTEFDNRLNGSATEVIDAMDPELVRGFELVARDAGGTICSIRFGILDNYNFLRQGVTLEIKAGNIGWTRQAVSTLESDLRRNVPKWSFLRSWTGTLLSAIAATALGAGLFAGFHIFSEDWILLLFFLGIGGWLGWWVPKRVLPGFSFSKQGSRVIGICGGLIASFLVGLIDGLIHL